MPYTYPIDPKAMFEDRLHQFVGFGLPLDDVVAVRDAITDMWADQPGGWVYEWSELARRYAAQDSHYLSSLAYGSAKFPGLFNQPRANALAHQLTEYQASAPTFGVRFERRILPVPYQDGTTDVPVHLLTTADRYIDAPVLIASGGVDTFKMDTHLMWTGFAHGAGVTVLAFDQPGTGETTVPLSSAADEVILGIAAAARSLGNGRVGHMGVSFGANFSAMTGLTGAVDASIALGGPIDHAFSPENLTRLPFGMGGIVGNALGFDHVPTGDEFNTAAAQLSRHDLLQRQVNSPMLVINGSDDYFVPQEDTLIFTGRRHTEVILVPDSGHIAMSKLPEMMPIMIGWLKGQLHGH